MLEVTNKGRAGFKQDLYRFFDGGKSNLPILFFGFVLKLQKAALSG